MPEQLVPAVEAARVSAKQPFHPGDQIRLGRLDNQVKMILHEDVGMNLPTCLATSLGQRGDEALAIRVVVEDRLAPVAAIHDVVNRPRILDSQFAGHDRRVARTTARVNTKLTISRTDPFTFTLYDPFTDPFTLY